MPDAAGLDVHAINSARTFEICNPLLGDSQAIDHFYRENGYLFFREVLDQGSVAQARDAMLAVAADKFGLVEKGDVSARWTGKPLGEDWFEEDPAFAGISRKLVETPHWWRAITALRCQLLTARPILNARLPWKR